jgi:hypothetical protein
VEQCYNGRISICSLIIPTWLLLKSNLGPSMEIFRLNKIPYESHANHLTTPELYKTFKMENNNVIDVFYLSFAFINHPRGIYIHRSWLTPVIHH